MATAQHGTLSAGQVTTVTLSYAAVCGYRALEILNADGAADIYATIDGSTPATAGSGTWRLPSAIGSIVFDLSSNSISSIVKLISAGTPAYSVVVE